MPDVYTGMAEFKFETFGDFSEDSWLKKHILIIIIGAGVLVVIVLGIIIIAIIKCRKSKRPKIFKPLRDEGDEAAQDMMSTGYNNKKGKSFRPTKGGYQKWSIQKDEEYINTGYDPILTSSNDLPYDPRSSKSSSRSYKK